MISMGKAKGQEQDTGKHYRNVTQGYMLFSTFFGTDEIQNSFSNVLWWDIFNGKLSKLSETMLACDFFFFSSNHIYSLWSEM